MLLPLPLLLLLLMPDVLSQSLAWWMGCLIICTFCCKDLLSFHADKRFTHIKGSGVTSKCARFIPTIRFVDTDCLPACLLVSFPSCFLALCIMFMDMNANVSHLEQETESASVSGMQWNEVISLADLVIYHYISLWCHMIHYLLLLLLLASWVMAAIWHWHRCINQLLIRWTLTHSLSLSLLGLSINPLTVARKKIKAVKLFRFVNLGSDSNQV